MNERAELLAFLSSPASYPGHPAAIEHHETHGAQVFLAGEHAYKIKRAVKFDYMDFSTLALRKAMIEREVAINRAFASELYLGVTTITRSPDGRLGFDGAGEPIEYAVHMRRFPTDALLSRLAAAGALHEELAGKLADMVAQMHARAAVHIVEDADRRMVATLAAVVGQLRQHASRLQPADVDAFEHRALRSLERARATLIERGGTGAVRRCHGDLHLGNIVVWRGEPTPFDALEFDENLATIDTLYDLAFLLMDLAHTGLCNLARIVLDRYLWRTRSSSDIDGLVALPLMLALRSAVRAMATAQRSALETNEHTQSLRDDARAYLSRALTYLTPPPPRMIAIGGWSGTGKSVLGAALAPLLRPLPGALHLRSDLERKALYGIAETERLPPSHYTRDTSERVYDEVLQRARRALVAGHSVVVDAAFLNGGECERARFVARELGVTFTGLWLTAPRQILRERVAARRDDASDATPAVVDRQLERHTAPSCDGWHAIDAGGTMADTLAAARSHAGL